MSDTDVRLSNYRLHAPQYQAYDPSGLELAFAQQMTQPGASQLVGYLAGSQLDRRNGSDQYSLALAETNRNAMLAGDAAERAADVRSRRSLVGRMLEHPDAAAVFGLSRAEIDPRMGQLAIDYALNHEAGQRARILEDVGTGMNQFSQAGLEMPQGATTDSYGFPRVPLRQGTSRAERVAAINDSGDGGAGGASLALREQGLALRQQQAAMAEANRRVQLSARQHNISGFTIQNGQFISLGNQPLSPQVVAQLEQLREAEYQKVLRELRGNRSQPAQPGQPSNAPPLSQGSYTLAPNGAPPPSAATTPPQAANTAPSINDIAGYARTQMTARGLDVAQHNASVSQDGRTIIVRRKADNAEVARIPVQ